MQLLESIAETAAKAPQRPAYCHEGTVLTYGQLFDEIQKYADLLPRQGTSPVLLSGEREPWMLIAMLACLMCRRTYVPVSAQTPQARLSLIAAQTGATLLLSDRPLKLEGVSCLPLSGLTGFAAAPQKEPDGAAPAYLIFTSGSSGLPKGVPISRSNLQNFAQWVCGLPQLRSERPLRVFGQAGFSFDLSVADIVFALSGGHTLVGMSAQSHPLGSGCSALFADIDAAFMTPTMLRLCLADNSFCAARYPRFRALYLCGEMFEAALARRLFCAFPSLCVLNAYGPTEATSAVCAAEITPELARDAHLLPVGTENNCAADISVENGEIVLRGNSVFCGYLGAPDDDLPRRGYCTGDLGFWENGFLYCKGRKDTQIKYKGYRIELSDIEENLCALSGVGSCAVIAKKDSAGKVRLLKAYVETTAEPFSPEALKAALAERLPPYMIPKVIRRTDALPISQNGKIDRKELESWN